MEHNWVHSVPCGPIPAFAVIGGHDSDGAPMYVGRSFHEGDQLPAKVIPSKNAAYVAWGGQEHQKSHYEILVGQGYGWVTCQGGAVPPNAVRSGSTRNGEPLYVGRGHHANSLCVGKIHPSHGCLYIPYGGQEVRVNTYEVLVKEHRDNWVQTSISYTPPGAVIGGHDSDRSVIFVGRSMHNGDMLPAKVIPSKGTAYVSFGGYEISKHNFDVLTGHGYYWVSAHHHCIPPNAVSTGQSCSGLPNYIGRGHYQGSVTPGLVSVSQRCLFIPYGGREIRLDSYEVLCRQ